MIILLTGATSKIGQVLLTSLVTDARISKIYALTRSQTKLPVSNAKVERVLGDFVGNFDVPEVDLCIHMAGITHTHDEDLYYQVNQRATVLLAQKLQKKGCRKFWYISSQTAGLNAGAYAESKFLAEKDLLALNWEQLLIIRPAEVVGAGGQEGLDKFELLAKKIKISPWLIGFSPIVFAPMTAEKLVAHLQSLLTSTESSSIQILRGPAITAQQFAFKMTKKYKAIPIPIFIPVLSLIAKVLRLIGLPIIPKDQIPRLLGSRGQKPLGSVKMETVQL